MILKFDLKALLNPESSKFFESEMDLYWDDEGSFSVTMNGPLVNCPSKTEEGEGIWDAGVEFHESTMTINGWEGPSGYGKRIQMKVDAFGNVLEYREDDKLVENCPYIFESMFVEPNDMEAVAILFQSFGNVFEPV